MSIGNYCGTFDPTLSSRFYNIFTHTNTKAIQFSNPFYFTANVLLVELIFSWENVVAKVKSFSLVVTVTPFYFIENQLKVEWFKDILEEIMSYTEFEACFIV